MNTETRTDERTHGRERKRRFWNSAKQEIALSRTRIAQNCHIFAISDQNRQKREEIIVRNHLKGRKNITKEHEQMNELAGERKGLGISLNINRRAQKTS